MVKKFVKRRGGRRGRKRGARRKGGDGGGYYKSANRRGQVMVNRTPARQHNVVAPHYFTRLESGFTGNIPAGQGPNIQWSFAANQLHEPFNKPVSSANIFTTGPAATPPAPAGVLVPATKTLAQLDPAGCANLSYLYSYARVYACKVDITLSPMSINDATLMVVSPMIDTAAEDAEDNPPFDTQTQMSEPYAKAITCTCNNNIKQNRISIYMDSATILGLTKRQYNDNPNTASVFGGNLSTSVLWGYLVSLELLSGNVNAAAIGVEVRTTYWCEFFNPNQMYDTVAS